MAKHQGFAALSALQTKLQPAPEAPADLTAEEHTPERGQTAPIAIVEDLGGLTDIDPSEIADEETTDPTSPKFDESLGTTHDVPPASDVVDDGIPEDTDTEEPESFASETVEANISTEVKGIAPAQPVFDEVNESIAPTERLLNELPVAEWTTDELKAYIAGQVKEETYLGALKLAITEYGRRETDLPRAWNVGEARDFFNKGIEPAKTSKGAWVNDVTRQFRREHEWETNELESWALGEIKAEGVTHDGGLAIELKRRLNLMLPSVDVNDVITNYKHATGQATKVQIQQRPAPKTPVVAEATIAEVTQKLKLEGLTPMNQSYLESSLATFEAVMKPGRAINDQKAGDSQKLLRECLTYAISLADPIAARSAMQFLLEYFRVRRADGQLFEDTYAYRGVDTMRATKAQQLAHRDLLTLFLAYADPMVEIRAQTDIPSLIEGVPAHLQSRVLEFFTRQA